MRGADGEHSVGINSIMWSNNGEVLRDAAIGHQGITLLPTFIVGSALQEGSLRTVLAEFEPISVVLCAIYPRHRHLSTKLRLFVDMLESQSGGRPYWDLVH
jgi:DNA-binding transcriptional LysR family regulator